MKTKKLLQRLREFLDADHAQQVQEIRLLRKLLGDLREKQRKLQGRLDDRCEDAQRQELRNRIEAIRAQRAKGIQRLRSLAGRLPAESGARD